MDCHPDRPAPHASLTHARPGSRAALRRRSIAAAAALAACCVLAPLAGGCGGPLSINTSDTSELDAVIQQSYDKPVMIDFWKFGCASCAMVDPVIDTLAREYEDRVVVRKFMAAHLWFSPTNRRVAAKYDFAFFPTVILFVDGQEKERWVWVVDTNAYRKTLDGLLNPPTTQPATPPTTQPAAPPTTQSADEPAAPPATQPEDPAASPRPSSPGA